MNAALPRSLDARLRRQSLLLAALFSMLLFGLSLPMIAWRVEQVLAGLTHDRTGRMVHELAEDGENGMRLGLTAEDLDFLKEPMARMARLEPSLRYVRVATAGGQSVAEFGDPALAALIDPHWSARMLAQAASVPGAGGAPNAAAITARAAHAHDLSGAVLVDPAGVPAATIWAVFDPAALRGQVRQATWAIMLRALPLALLGMAVAVMALLAWSRQTVRMLQPGAAAGGGRTGRWLLALLALFVLGVPLGLVGIARETARPFVTAQVESNADAVAATVASSVERALRLGVPLNALQGMEALLAAQLTAAPELSGLSLLAPAAQGGQVLSRSAGKGAGGPALLRERVLAGSGARVAVSYPADYADRILGAMLVDLFLALVIAAVLMRELTRSLWRRSLLHPLMAWRLALSWQGFVARMRRRRGHDAAAGQDGAAAAASHARHALGWQTAGESAAASGGWSAQMPRLRLAVFLVALSEELLRPFFTVLASEMDSPGGGWTPEMLAGVPVAAFMATLAAAQPLGPWIARRLDIRLTLIASSVAGALALAASAWVHQAAWLVALRAVGGVAYGLALILAQTAVVRFTPPAQRAQGLTEVATAIVAAGIVGPPFGGMIAGQVGNSHGMVACALAMLLAFIPLALLRLPDAAAHASGATASARGGWRGYAAVLREPRAMTIIWGSGVPARLVAVAVLTIVVPLSVSGMGQPPAVAGRVLLLYFLCYALMASLMAHWSDATGERRAFIVAGCLISGAACLAVPLVDGLWGLALCCALLGVGQATQSPSQIAMVTEVFEAQPVHRRTATPEQAIAAYRLIERLGSVAAPFVTALAIFWAGQSGAMVVIGMLVALAGMAVWAGLRTAAVLRAAA